MPHSVLLSTPDLCTVRQRHGLLQYETERYYSAMQADEGQGFLYKHKIIKFHKQRVKIDTDNNIINNVISYDNNDLAPSNWITSPSSFAR